MKRFDIILFIFLFGCLGLSFAIFVQNHQNKQNNQTFDKPPTNMWYNTQNGQIQYWNDGVSIPLN